MAQDFSDLATTEAYAALLARISDRDVALALGCDPATTSPTNVKTNTLRWNSANRYWEKYSGSAWAAMTSSYNITADRASALVGGAAGALVYQTGASATGYSAAGTAGQVAVSGGTGAPTWSDLGLITYGYMSKSTPVDADSVLLSDSASANAPRKLTFANLKLALTTFFDTLYAFVVWGGLIAGGTSKATPVDADALAIADSAASNATKKLTWGNLKATLLATAHSWSGAQTLAGQVLAGNILTVAQITADEDDYSPTGLATRNTVRLSSDAARNITGLAGGADGRLLLFHNAGSYPITFKDESASSTAANRFALADGDLVVQPDGMVLLQYDLASTRWRYCGVTPQDTHITLKTEQATTSGTAIDFTSIAPGANRITVMCNGVSLSGTDGLLIQIGDAGGIETNNYKAIVGGVGTTSSTSGFINGAPGGSASNTYHGSITLMRQNGSHTWVAQGVLACLDANTGACPSAGAKTLSAELTQVRITTTGSNTFDAGAINVAVE